MKYNTSFVNSQIDIEISSQKITASGESDIKVDKNKVDGNIDSQTDIFTDSKDTK